MIHVLLTAAYASTRAALHTLLAGAGDCVVVGHASGSAELERLLPDLRPDVVLLDTAPGDAGRVIEFLRGTETGLVLLGDAREDGARLAQGGLAGWAWLRQDADAGEIVGALCAAGAGLAALDPVLLPLLTSDSVPARADAPVAGETLTAREHEVLQLLAQGLPNKQIAARLGISLHTAKFHVASILAKLGATSRTEAVTLGVRRGHVLL